MALEIKWLNRLAYTLISILWINGQIMQVTNYIKVLGLMIGGWLCLQVSAQQVWSIDRCMMYAVDHNRTVKQRELEVKNYKLDRLQAIGSFLPGVSGSTGVQYNYGRSVDPETNIYNNVSTFNNSYGLSGSLTIFRGGSLVQELKRSKAALSSSSRHCGAAMFINALARSCIVLP